MDTIFVFEDNLEDLHRFREANTDNSDADSYRKRDQCDTICEICGKLIKFKPKRHMLTHSQDRNYSCHLCDKTFRMPFVLAAHLKTHFSKSFQCKVCGIAFVRKSVLKIHARIHSGVRPYTCHICQSSFSQKAILFRHLDTHSDKKCFHCEQCNTSYRRKSTMEAHLRSKKHLNTTKENLKANQSDVVECK